jgi:hypothetical protein
MAELTEDELLNEAKKIKRDADKKIKLLKEKAKQKKEKNLAEFGLSAIKFLKEEISLNDLKTVAENKNLIIKKEITNE